MGLGNMLKWLVRDDSPRDEAEESEESYYRPNRVREMPRTAELTDNGEDSFRGLRTQASEKMQEAEDEELSLDDFEDVARKPVTGEPEIRQVRVEDISSASVAVDLALDGVVVLLTFDDLPEEDLITVQSYLAGAVHAMGGYINPVNENNVFMSVDEFDITPYLPEDEN